MQRQAPSGTRFQIRTVLSPLQEARTGPAPAGFQASAHTRSAWPARRWASRSSVAAAAAAPSMAAGRRRWWRPLGFRGLAGCGVRSLEGAAGAERGRGGEAWSNRQKVGGGGGAGGATAVDGGGGSRRRCQPRVEATSTASDGEFAF